MKKEQAKNPFFRGVARFSLLSWQCFLSLSASAQQFTASGQVLDAQKEPLIGVSVQEKKVRLTEQ